MEVNTDQILENMVKIPAGEFIMGSEEGDFDEEPVHLVSLEAFSIGKYQVTQAQYESVMGTNPSRFKEPYKPVESVTWHEAQEFCQKLTELTGNPKIEFKLPSEAQWEYACRAGSEGKWCFGDDESQLGEYAWYSKNSDSQTHTAGQKKPNAFGLYDMHGNVWEWCEDHMHNSYEDAPTDGSSWTDEDAESGRYRVVRGGSWLSNVDGCRSARRNLDCPKFRNNTIGFRICSGRRK